MNIRITSSAALLSAALLLQPAAHAEKANTRQHQIQVANGSRQLSSGAWSGSKRGNAVFLIYGQQAVVTSVAATLQGFNGTANSGPARLSLSTGTSLTGTWTISGPTSARLNFSDGSSGTLVMTGNGTLAGFSFSRKGPIQGGL